MTQYEKDSICSAKRGMVGLCLATSTGANIISSLEIAEHIGKTMERGKVLYINTVQTERQLASEIRKHVSKSYSKENADPRITYLTSSPGLLSSMGKQITRILESGIRYVIINSLEFSSKDHRRKEELMYQVMNWTNIFGACILIFGEEANDDPVTGKIQRGGGGVGKLAALAKKVFHITSEADREEVVDFKTSMSQVVLPADDEDDDFTEIDEQIAALIAGETEQIDKSPDWKPANLSEEIELFKAYMKNHPKLKFHEGVILSNQRDHVMRLIAAEKKRDAKREKKRSRLSQHASVIQANMPDRPPVSSNEKPVATEEAAGARVLFM